MFSTLLDDPKNELLKDRLAKLEPELRALGLPTRQELQAEIYSRVNAILELGNDMQPLLPVVPEGPAAPGDLSNNFSRLNQDSADIASELLSVEDTSAKLFNLAASSQNAIRQQIREIALGSTSSRYREEFLNDHHIDPTTTATIDFNAGLASLNLIKEEVIAGTITVGSNSTGTQVVGTEALSDDKLETALIWEGTQLELIVAFSQPEIINRLTIALDDYQGLEIVTLISSPDGILAEDILSDLGLNTLSLNGIIGKYSGDFILDFPPRHIQQLRIVIQDRVGEEHIALRSMNFLRRSYSSSAQLVSLPVSVPGGTLLFTTDEFSSPSLTSITHQISYNGVYYQNISPGASVALSSSPFWYRSLLDRSQAQFDSGSSPLVAPTSDPAQNTSYVVSSLSSVPLGGGIIERVIVFSNIIGPVVIRDVPLPGTLQVQSGSVILSQSAGDYAFSGSTLSFPGDQSLITLTYQTSSLGAASLLARRDFYSPYLKSVSFSKVG